MSRAETKILVLEDDDRVRGLALAVLNGLAQEVVGVASLDDARQFLAVRSFDLLVFDLNVVGGASTEVAMEVRAGDYPTIPQDTPILLMTTISPNVLAQIPEGTFDESLAKPWAIAEFLAVANRLLEKRASVTS